MSNDLSVQTQLRSDMFSVLDMQFTPDSINLLS